MNADEIESREEPDIDWQDVRRWAEFSCWTTLVLAPIPYWFNGPSVSTDQFVVRTALLVLAGVGAVTLRCCSLLASRRP